jgi:uncharacterized protein (DUF433 family)/predicted nuclease of predicted toxin-antitoxin system
MVSGRILYQSKAQGGDMMDWQARIVVDPEILVRKPVIKGTRLAVEFIIDLLAQGWTEADILRNYPGLARQDIQACLASASTALKAEKVYPLAVPEAQHVRILADENFPGDAVIALRERGHDIAWVRSDAPGSSDPQIIARAQAEGRVLVTFDKDLCELTFRTRLSASSGVVLFRISASSPAFVARVAVAALESRADWAGHFAVVEDDRIRMTLLPGRL